MQKFLMSFVMFFVSVNVLSVNADAQESAVAAIRSHYQKTQARIQKLATEEGKSEGLYLYLISDNYHEGSWPGVGYFKYEEKYYYELDDNRGKKIVKISISRAHASRFYDEEYLFDDKGDLIFAFHKTVEDDERTERYYYKNEIPIRVIENGRVTDKLNDAQKKAAESVKKSAKGYASMLRSK
jgi:hypothetical protein